MSMVEVTKVVKERFFGNEVIKKAFQKIPKLVDGKYMWVHSPFDEEKQVTFI